MLNQHSPPPPSPRLFAKDYFCFGQAVFYQHSRDEVDGVVGRLNVVYIVVLWVSDQFSVKSEAFSVMEMNAGFD